MVRRLTLVDGSGNVVRGETDLDLLAWNNNRQEWETASRTSIVGAAAAASAPLSAVRVVDKGTTVPLASQNGSFEAPFSTLQAGLDSLALTVATEVCLLVAPGDYTAEPIMTFNGGAGKRLQLTALQNPAQGTDNSSGPKIPGITFTGLGGLKLSGLQYDDPITAASTNVYLDNCTVGFDGDVTAGNDFFAFNCYFNNAVIIVANNIRCESCELQGQDFQLDATVVELQSCVITSAISVDFNGAAGTVRLDSMTRYYWNQAAVVLTNGSVVDLIGGATMFYANWGQTSAPAVAATRYIPRTNAALVTAPTSGEYPVGNTGTFRFVLTWRVFTSLAVDTVAVTVMVNGVATALAFNVTPGATGGQAAASLSVVAGDGIAIRLVQNGAEAQAAWNFNLSLVATL